MGHGVSANNQSQPGSVLTLQARPEHKFIRSEGSECAIALHIRVGSAPAQKKSERLPLKLALVLDRSGSMQGEKLRIAKQATLAVLDQLTERDRVSVVVFDNQIDVVQSVASVTPTLKSQVKAALQGIEARASTALHEGWLTGCNTLVSDAGVTRVDELGRCFLLTDGIANQGVTDPEQIANEAAGVREHTNISTSTFGIGQDYNELLLGPMAVAGGGQFHHLRSPEEIFRTFIGELGELLSVAARQVRLEMELETGLTMELVSAYWMDAARKSIAIGDLQYDEEQHVVIRVRFPAQWSSEKRTVRARLVWLEAGNEHKTDWQELHFVYASESICRDELPDAEVLRWAGQHEADRARREAIVHNNSGDIAGAQAALQRAAQQMAPYAAASPMIQQEVHALDDLRRQMANAPLAPGAAKEQYYQQQRRSRNKADHRSPEPGEQDQK